MLKDDATKKLFLWIFIGLLILYLDFTYIIKRLNKNISLNQGKIVNLKKEINTLDKELSNIEDLKQKKGQFVLKAKRLISEGEIPALLENISTLANANKVQIMQMRQPKGKEEIALELTCGYHALGGFINALENARQMTALQEMKIERNENDYFRHRVTMVLKVYVKK